MKFREAQLRALRLAAAVLPLALSGRPRAFALVSCLRLALLGFLLSSASAHAYDRQEVLKPNLWYQNSAGPTANYFKRQDAEAAARAHYQTRAGCDDRQCLSIEETVPCNGTGRIWGQAIDECVILRSVNRASGQVSTNEALLTRIAGWACPADYYRSGGPWDQPFPTCFKTVRTQPPRMCRPGRYGNPISIATGSKEETAVDYEDPKGLLTLRRFYSSLTGGFQFDFERAYLRPASGSTTDPQRAYGCKRLYVNDVPGQDDCFQYLTEAPNYMGLLTEEGDIHTFVPQSGNWAALRPSTTIVATQLPQTGNWQFHDKERNTQYIFDESGRLRTKVTGGVGRVDVEYDGAAKLPTRLTDMFGRSLLIRYNAYNQIAAIVLPDATEVRYEHASLPPLGSVPSDVGVQGMVPSRVTYADGTSREYLWNEPAFQTGPAYYLPSKHLLTGIVDEAGSRYSTFRYVDGKAVETLHGTGLDRWQISDPRLRGSGLNGQIQLTTPIGSQLLVTLNADGLPLSMSQPAGSGCGASSSQTSYDTNGNTTQRDDFNGFRTCFSNDTSRNLETVRVEGLGVAATCSAVTPANASLPVGSRKTTTQWHPDWGLKTQVAEPGRITTYVYNGQPDPFNSGATANCAPASALLPDGKPIAVLCKKVEQSTTDANGSQGFAAAVQPGVPNRVWQWTYNAQGQMLTERDPLNNQTTNVYYTSTTPDYTLGDLQSTTNAAGHVTRYPRYNRHGQALQTIDPNGVTTDHTYDERQRLLTSTTAGRTTSYTYEAGQLRRITSPDASYVTYEYDPAHRLTAVADHQGNRIEYVLDNAGNRLREEVKDPSGTLTRQLARVTDALGRTQQTTGRE